MADAVTGALGAAPSAVTSSQATGLGALDGQAFLKLMVAQLKYQNPFEPMDTSQMLQQTASLTTVETLQSVASNQTVLMGLQQASMATSLLGEKVSALAADGSKVVGTVDGISFTADGPMLRIGDQDVPLGNVTKVNELSDGSETPETQG